MCGFFFAKYKSNFNNDSINDFFEIECNNYIKNRGPSYQEIYKTNSFFIYQSTLAIQSNLIKSNKIDALGSKKFILYNGEIFGLDNSISDTEYIFDLCRRNELDHKICELDGMFVICNFMRINNNEIVFHVYRDATGEKHVWYYIDEDIIILSSVPAIIRKYLAKKGNLKVNRNAIDEYLKRRHLISPLEHPIKNLNSLKPGYKLSFNSEKWDLVESQYFDYRNLFSIELYKELSNMNQITYNNEFKKIFIETISKMEAASASSKISSSIISGGLDSSIVGAYLLNNDIKTDIYTMTFNEKDPVSKNVKNILEKNFKFNEINHKVIECNLDEYHYALCRSINILSSPVNTHSIPSSYLVASRAQQDGNLILYGGEGADEIFLGYDCYMNSDINSSVYNGLNNNYSFDKDLDKRVINSKTEEYIRDFKSKINDYLSNFEILDKREVIIKTESFTDIFIQLNSVGLLSTDTINSDLGIECRTPFVRRELLKFGISSPVEKLINYEKKSLNNKLPIRNKFIEDFGEESIMPKIGFAGFPNETKNLLGKKNDWNIWNYLNWNKNINQELTISEEWKLINLEWFLRLIYS